MQPDTLSLSSNPFIAIQEERIERQGYTDMVELDECLKAFYDGTLDNVDDLSRLWMPLEQLIPGKRLLSQLDSDTLRRCIYQLDELHRTAIAHRWEPECPELLQTMAHYFVHNTQWQHFGQFCGEAYTDALVSLALIVYKVL